MKRLFPLFFLLPILPFLLGMGSLTGGDSSGKIPVPEKNFTATFVDQMDVMTECSSVSIEGETFVEGKIGDGTFTISFDNINYVLFLFKDGSLKGIVKLHDGKTVELVLNKNHKAYGRTKYGAFHIKLPDLKKIIIGSSPQILD
ncbi:MAG: hypothetical protein WC560_07350 [Syntrophales bacterium]